MIEPAGHRVLVLPDPVKDQTAGGLFIPEAVKQKEQRAAVYGTVIKTGPNAWKAFDDGRAWAEVGNRIVYAQYGGMVVKDTDGTEYRLLNDEDVVAVIKEEA